MTDPLKTLLALPELAATAFPPSSRYHGLETGSRRAADGTVQTYLRRRFSPDPDRLSLLQSHRVALADRLDLLASVYFGDAELFWRICDGNGAIRPNELIETVGRRLQITEPEGIPGADDG